MLRAIKILDNLGLWRLKFLGYHPLERLDKAFSAWFVTRSIFVCLFDGALDTLDMSQQTHDASPRDPFVWSLRTSLPTEYAI